MALADKNGEVMASIPGLADLSRVTIEECETAIKSFLSPDKYSRTKTAEGRRIQEINGGWFLINHPEYRALASKEDSMQKAAERMARHRRNKALQGVTVAESKDIAEAEANPDADAEADPLKYNKGCLRTRDGKVWAPRFPYPQSPEEMEQTLAQHEVDYHPNWDGNFFLEMQANRWIVDGRPVFDWVTLYKSRTDLLKDCAGYDDMLPM